MNLDQIKKLIRLANNNPNEHEANSAARRVCKLLADFEFLIKDTSSPTRSSGNPSGWDPFQDIFRRAEAAQKAREAREQKEREEKKQNPWTYEPDGSYEKFYKDFWKGYDAPFGNAKKDIKCPKCKGSTYYSPQTMQYSCSNPNCKYTFTQLKYDAYNIPHRPEKRIRTCAQCGKEVETKRITNIFKCDNCEWTDWEKSRAESGKAPI